MIAINTAVTSVGLLRLHPEIGDANLLGYIVNLKHVGCTVINADTIHDTIVLLLDMLNERSFRDTVQNEKFLLE